MNIGIRQWISRAANIASIVVVVLAIILMVAPRQSRTARSAEQRRIAPEVLLRWYDRGVWVGPRDATVRIVNFTDYTCHFCAIQESTLSKLLATFPQHVAVITRIIPSPRSEVASRLAIFSRCAAGLGHFSRVHPELYKLADRTAPFDTTVAQLGRIIGVPLSASIARCFGSRGPVSETQADVLDAVQLGVAVTPVLVINGMLRPGVTDFPALSAIVSSEMRRAETDYLAKSLEKTP